MLRRLRLIPRRSLGGQIMVLLGAALLVTLVASSASVTYFVYQTELAAWRGRQGEAARNAAETVASVVERAQDTLAVVSVINPVSLKANQAELDKLLDQNAALDEVVRLDSGGQVVLDSTQDRPVLAQLITIPQSQWFLDARSGKTYLGPVQLSSVDEPYLLMAIPAPEGGVVAARVRLDVLWTAVANIRFGQSGRAYVVTRDGDIVAHTRQQVVLAGTNIGGRPELQAVWQAPGAEWAGTYVNFEGVPVVGASAPVSGTNWVVMTELPQAEAFAASRRAVVVLGGGLLALALLVTWVIGRTINRRIVRPMAQLRDGAARIGQGDLAHRIGLARQDEIGQLAAAFDEMAAHLAERGQQVAAQTAALQISEARYRAIVEDQTELICRFLPDQTLTFVNEAYCRFFGRPREELVGQTFTHSIPASALPDILAALARLTPDRPVQSGEDENLLSDGRSRWLQWVNRAIFDARGQLVEYVSVGRDITERRAAQIALLTSEARYRAIVEDQTELICRYHADGTLTFVNDAYCRCFGLTPDQLIGQRFAPLIVPEDRPMVEALTASLGLQHPVATIEERVVMPDGTIRWQQWTSRVLLDPGGQIVEFQAVGRDVTERKQAEEALRESERRYRLLAENASDVIWVRDLSLRLTYLSPAVTKLRGFSVDEALRQEMTETLTPASARQARAQLTEMLAAARNLPPEAVSRQTLTIEAENSCKDGSTVWTESQVSLLLDEQGQPSQFLGVTRDIAERRRAADELRRLNAELEERVRQRTAELTRANADLTVEIHERQQAEQRSAAFSALGQQLSAATTPETAAEVIVATADQLLGWDACFLDLYRAEQDLIQTALAFDVVDGRRTRLPMGDVLSAPTATLRKVFAEGGQLMLSDHPETTWPDLETFGDATRWPASLLFVPIRHGAQIIGGLSIQSYTPNAYDQAGLKTLQALADHCGGALERIGTEERIRASLRDKEVLLKEIHHRVKNNLQVISSLLNLQSRQVTDPHALEMLRDSQNRVRSMALVHEKLYRSADLAHVDFSEYIRGLAAQLLRTYADQAAAVALTVQAESCQLDVELAVSCGLILNELISNALKHAFPGGRSGEIRLSLQPGDAGRVSLRVSDDGVGWPAGLDFRNSSSLGLQLVNTLVDQIGGTVALEAGPGASFCIEFSTTPLNTQGEPI